jgi:hypothetical protein
VLYAAPDGPYQSGQCEQERPCDLDYAVETEARPGDEVIVAPGDYDLSPDIHVGQDLYVHGTDGQPRPRLFGFLSAADGARVRYLAIWTGDTAALSLAGVRPFDPPNPTVGEELLVTATGSAATGRYYDGTASVRGGAVLRDSVVTASGDGDPAVRATSSAKGELRNVTAIATGPNSVGILATHIICIPMPFGRCYSNCTSAGEIEVKNSIARGTLADIRATGFAAGCPATLSISFSNFRAEGVSDSDGTIIMGRANQTSVDPLFVNAAAGDFHQMPTSPTIDAGTSRDPLMGATDIDGQRRRLGLRPDIGADEAPDADGDGHSDGADNCRRTRNQSQADRDQDGKGDACDRLVRGRCANLVIGTAAGDDLIGTRRGDRIRGLAGDDALAGRRGADCLVGGHGDNSYRAGRGNDHVSAANGEKETVDCGRGKSDMAVVDEADVVARCEHLRRT